MTALIRSLCLVILGVLIALAGCASDPQAEDEFYTSGNREADQRAEQRMAQKEQLAGKENGQGKAPEAQTLYARLGGEQGIVAIVDDYVARVLSDPRVNWERKGVEHGGFLQVGEESSEWQPTPPNVQKLKKHMVQFLSLATGGPADYQGREMEQVHGGMKIDNAEFDAAMGDLKATLDKLAVGTDEQKELLAVFESTRPQVVKER